MKTRIKFDIDITTNMLHLYSAYFDVICIEKKWYEYKTNKFIPYLDEYLSKKLKKRKIIQVCIDDFWPNRIQFRFTKKTKERDVVIIKQICGHKSGYVLDDSGFFWI
jgi:hypothetical protein